MEWISVKKKLPKINQLVIVTNISSKHKEDHWVCCGVILEDGEWYNQFQDSSSEPAIIPTHWMPLPEPPKQ
jgi:hypothetical protein